MNELLTVANLFNVILVIIGFSINRELHHLGEAIRETRETANAAHNRIDVLLTKGN